MKKLFVFLSPLTFLLLTSCASLETKDSRLHTFHTVVLDAGHGGYDSGTRAAKGIDEKNLNLDVVQRVKPLLEAQGYHVVMTRTNDTFVPLSTRTAIANSHPDSIFVSIHFNASPKRSVSGVETYYYQHTSEPLAATLFQELCHRHPCLHRGVKKASFYVLRHNHQPATLLELGFISNRKENSVLQTPKMRQQIAGQITEGITKTRTL